MIPIDSNHLDKTSAISQVSPIAPCPYLAIG
jgi:hypothetical protein